MAAVAFGTTDFASEPRALIDILREQRIVAGDTCLAEAIADDADILSFGSGEALLDEGDNTDHMLFVLEGAVEVDIGGTVVATIPGSCLVGEMALFQPEPRRSATVRATELTVCARLSAPAFRAIARTWPGALTRMIDVIRERDPNTTITGFAHES